MNILEKIDLIVEASLSMKLSMDTLKEYLKDGWTIVTKPSGNWSLIQVDLTKGGILGIGKKKVSLKGSYRFLTKEEQVAYENLANKRISPEEFIELHDRKQNEWQRERIEADRKYAEKKKRDRERYRKMAAQREKEAPKESEAEKRAREARWQEFLKQQKEEERSRVEMGAKTLHDKFYGGTKDRDSSSYRYRHHSDNDPVDDFFSDMFGGGSSGGGGAEGSF